MDADRKRGENNTIEQKQNDTAFDKYAANNQKRMCGINCDMFRHEDVAEGTCLMRDLKMKVGGLCYFSQNKPERGG